MGGRIHSLQLYARRRLAQEEVIVNQWELTYLAPLPKETPWQVPADWSTFLPGLFGNSEPAEAPTQSWSLLLDELFRIRNLKDDWDGEGTEALHPALVDGAITLAQHLQAKGVPPADRVLAGVNGTIYFEWHMALGYQEIEVTSPMDAECRWVPKGSDVTEVINLSRRS